MRFVLGRPVKGVKGHKITEKDFCWYVCLDCEDADLLVAGILNARAKQFLNDPHGKGEFSTHVAMVAASGLALQMETGMHKRRGYYANRSGGMCPNLYEIIEDVEADDWPCEAKVEISKWMNGTHYYVKVNGSDFEWKGKYKWNTREAAENAVEAWKKSEGIS